MEQKDIRRVKKTWRRMMEKQKEEKKREKSKRKWICRIYIKNYSRMSNSCIKGKSFYRPNEALLI